MFKNGCAVDIYNFKVLFQLTLNKTMNFLLIPFAEMQSFQIYATNTFFESSLRIVAVALVGVFDLEDMEGILI